ncbi:MAG: hypothetical protein ACP5EN_00755 [Rhodovulum sp.]
MRKTSTLFFLIVFFNAFSVASAKDMAFDVFYGAQTTVIVASGEITSETPQKFQEFLNKGLLDGFQVYIDLNSPGGNLMGGMIFGNMIREQGLTTRVASYSERQKGKEYWHPSPAPGICLSACALAYLGGKDRKLENGSILGFHQFSSAGSASGKVENVYETETTTQMVSGVVHNYISSMGISSELFSKMSLTRPDEMYLPTPDDLRNLNIIPAEAFRDFTLEPYGQGVLAYAEFLGNVEGRSMVSQITAYCKGGTPFLLLSKPTSYSSFDENWLRFANDELDGFSLWKPPGTVRVDYPSSHVDLRIGGQPVAEIKIDKHGVTLLMDEAMGVVQLPAALGIMSFRIQPTERDKRLLGSAFNLCIR